MHITKPLFDSIRPGEIFKTVTTRYQNVRDALRSSLTFACVKGKSGLDWAIFAAGAGSHPEDVARYGEKVHGEENIRSLCPCDQDVLELYLD